METNDVSGIQWELMLPHQFRNAIDKLPVCFLPLGTVEWHGEHNALGLDSLKAHALCVEAARKAGGGVVHPPVYGGMGGLDKPATIRIEEANAWENTLLRPWLERLLSEIHRIGFRAVIVLTGHYGHNQQIVVREAAVRMMQRLQIPVLGTPEYWLALDVGYHGDHAGTGETSLLWHLRPELVSIELIDNDPVYGRNDKIKNGSSPELGRRYAEVITERLAKLAAMMPTWDRATRQAFAGAESAIVDAQVEGWRTHQPWAAWAQMSEMVPYGGLLLEKRFEEIEGLAERLLP